MHMHTNRTDGEASISAIMSRAVEQGLSCVAFTEHVRRDTKWFLEFAGEVRTTQESYPQLEVLVGCEAKALNKRGLLDATNEILAECDIVLGSVHRFPDGQGGYIDFSTLSQEKLAQMEYELALGLLDAAPIDVLAHPGGMYFRQYAADFPTALMCQLLEKSLEREIAIEISSSYLRDFGTFLQLCAEVNPYVSIGSDMHRLKKLGDCRNQLLSHGVGAV